MKLSRLYAILDSGFCESRGVRPLELLDVWLDAGVTLVQLRAKSLESGAMLELAEQMVERARAARATFIVNDRADVARFSGADGVHVGQDDLTPADVRAVIGAKRLVGLSTHTAGQVEAGCREPVSYLAIGPVFTTGTKGPVADVPVGLDGVRRAAELARGPGLPVVAIGGISLNDARRVLDTGAASIAVISDLLAGDPARRVREYLAALA